jgi:hypothetical protein
LGALIAFHLDANREKGGICGGLVASRLLALHGVVPHILDLQFPVEKLDFNSMIHHKFVSPHSCLNKLTFEITFFKKSTWKVVKTDRSVHLPAPLLFNLDRRNGWSLMTHKYRGSQQSSREVKPKFIDSTQGESKNICKP